MRIPNHTSSETLVGQLQRLTARQSQLQDQVASGQRITRASDDPAAMGRVLQLQAEKQGIQQFASNNDRALALTQTSFAAVSQLKSVSDRASEIAILGSGVTSPDAFPTYAAETDQLLEQALQVANSAYSGEQLFGGTKSDTPPFSATRDASGRITAVTYHGAAAGAEVRISEGGKLSPFTSGAENQGIATFMNNLVALRDALRGGDAAAVQTARGSLESSEDDLLVTISDIGAKQTRLEAAAAQNTARFAELERLTAAETDIDLAQTVVKLTQAQTAYQAALQSGAQTLNLSLLDYLR